MKVLIKRGFPYGNVLVPPSKSYAHRYLIAGLLAGNSTISNIEYSDDINATLGCLEVFGCSFNKENDKVITKSTSFNNGVLVFDANESGSTLRFLIPIILTKYHHFIIKGSKRLISRGVDDYVKCFKNVSLKTGEDYIEVEGSLQSGDFYLDASKSSQYLTGLLYALPLLDGDSKIILTSEVSSANYVDMTVEALEKFGIEIKKSDEGYFIKGNQSYTSNNVEVEGDYSNASFLDAFNYLGGNVSLKGLKEKSLQGDSKYINYFKKLSNEYSTIDINNSIDLAPVLFAFASLNKGGHFTGTSRLKIKESDRALAMKENLARVGIDVEVLEDEVIIKSYEELKVQKVSFDSYTDHRIAMALSLFATKMDVEINDCECVKKSFPTFFEVLEKLGMEVKYYE